MKKKKITPQNEEYWLDKFADDFISIAKNNNDVFAFYENAVKYMALSKESLGIIYFIIKKLEVKV